MHILQRTTTAITAAVLALTPLLASAQTVDTELNFLRRFARPGAADAFDQQAKSLAYTDIDFRAYVSHVCYNIASSIERQQCKHEFGDRADLREVLASGELFRMLLTHARFDVPNADVIDVSPPNVDAPRTGQVGSVGRETSLDPTIYATRRDRSATLWSECARMTVSVRERSQCYQANISRVNQRLGASLTNNLSMTWR